MPRSETASWKSEGLGHWLTVAWADALQRVMGSAAGDFQVASVDPGAWNEWLAPFWYRLEPPAFPNGGISVGIPEPTSRATGGDADPSGALLELVNRLAAAAGEIISARIGKQVRFSAAQPCEFPSNLENAFQIAFLLEGSTYVLGVAPDPGLVRDWEAEAELLEASGQGATPPGIPGNLDLLLEVELPLCVTFGRTQLPLKDVLKLSSGSIVELNRLVNEPVEVLINNCVIARGEVVVVDGNYGIRVTEIVSRQERIRSIF